MIGVIFQFGTEIIEVRIDGNNCLFRTKQTGNNFAQIDNLKLDYKGVCREFPDLETRDDWKIEAIKRFKDKIKSFDTEDKKIEYIVNDLKKFGYKPLYKQKQGHRIEKY